MYTYEKLLAGWVFLKKKKYVHINIFVWFTIPHYLKYSFNPNVN